MGAIQKLFVKRSIRLQSRPDRSGNLVRFDFGAPTSEAANPNDHHSGLQVDSQKSEPVELREIAQYADVSATGMRLVSRSVAWINKGDLIQVEFTLPGEDKRIAPKAKVVRRINEYVFAVQFHEMAHDQAAALKAAIVREIDREKWSSVTGTWQTIANWISDNRKAIWIALAAWVVIGGLGINIYVNSDEYLGKKLRAWGSLYPKEWDLDYIRGFNIPKKDDKK